MPKILKNTTLSDISIKDTGITISASSQYSIPPQDYLLWAASIDIETPVNNGNLVVNDGVGDLSAFNGLNYLKHPDFAFNIRFLAQPERMNGFASRTVQEAIEEAKSAIEGKISVLPTFLNNGNTSNKWLSLDGSMSASDILPAISTFNSKFAGMTFINSSNGANIDLEFYRNGILVFTWMIRNARYAWKTNGLDAVTVSTGDRISCFARNAGGGNPSSVIVNLFVQSTDSLITEGSSPTL